MKIRKSYVLKFAILITIFVIIYILLRPQPDLILLHYETCDQYPNSLVANLKKNENLTISEMILELKNLSLSNGGKWSRSNIDSGKKVAIIVPYRNRLKNLKTFIRYMHYYLTEQGMVNYGIYLVEPYKTLIFNRALLINIGFVEALKDDNYNCFIFHDVDMLPENKLNFYECHDQYPKQFAISISIYNYSSINYFKYNYTGGVTAFTKDQFEKINGYSNLYFGWGGEDDDVYLRCKKIFKKMHRLTPEIGRYYANCHKKEEENEKRTKLLDYTLDRMETDGLNSLRYKVLKTYRTNLFTLFHVHY